MPKKKPTKPPIQKPKMPSPLGILLIVALALSGISMLLSGTSVSDVLGDNQPEQEITVTELLQKFEKNELTEILAEENTLQAKDASGTTYTATKEPYATLADLGLYDTTKQTKITVEDTSGRDIWMNILIGVAPFLLLILFFVFLSRKAGGMGGESGPFGFGKSRAKEYDPTQHKTKFSDIAGAEEAKDDVAEVVDFLMHPKRYERMGAKIPRGILLVGPPGTGKTLLARAIAGEAEVPFYSVSGSEFVEMFVGVGAARVRDLFKNAKKHAPAIIFIDEIDAIGKKRGQGYGGGHDEREQTLNQILTEMDGFEVGATVIVIAATNRPDVLDNALLRPGRFDRRIHIDLPDMVARRKILDIHARNKSLDADVSLDAIASKTVGFSGADIENLLNEAAIRAVKNKRESISQEDLEQAVEKVSMGPERRSRRITDKEKKIIAYHEVGHAIAGHFTDNDPVHKISIISRGMALGLTWFLPEEDTYLQSEQRMKDKMVSLHGGRVAEMLTFGQMTTGASNDLERISQIARSMVMTYGMGGSTLGPVVFQQKSRGHSHDQGGAYEPSPETERLIDTKVRELVQEAEDRCRAILEEHADKLVQISEDLLERENIYREEFVSYFNTPE